MEELSSILEKLPAKYADLRIVRHKLVQVALRTDSSDLLEEEWTRVACRVVTNGYGVASTDKTDQASVEQAAFSALKLSKLCDQPVELLPTSPEQGRVEHVLREEFQPQEVFLFLKSLRSELKSRLNAPARIELIASHLQKHSILITSEGTRVEEHTPLTDLTIYIVAKDLGEGFASRTVGGRGGFEIIRQQPWEGLLEKLVRRVKDSITAKPSTILHFSYPYLVGRFKVVLDPEAAGALAHEVAHFLEADVYRETFFKGLKYEFQLVDNPLLKDAYGSFHWDDEGVRARVKNLLTEEGVSLLHTRLTARNRGEAGNARGITHKPRPCVSNVYIQPSDWSEDEIFQDTQNGVYAEGLVRAECRLDDGRIEIEPELAYVLKNKEATTPVKHLKIICSLRDIRRIDAAGKSFSLRPGYEKGFPISEGAPFIRINGAICR
ncbi:MAG: TldD/PmbA family protein [Thaumarchaeota archaeon]|jgi:TldD protein|nr:TldD/PmbA family protein [Nitrososphaerota archaeon]